MGRTGHQTDGVRSEVVEAAGELGFGGIWANRSCVGSLADEAERLGMDIVSRRTRLLLICVVAAVLLLSAPSQGAVALRGLPDCLGRVQVRPSRVVLACAGGGFGADRLTWQGWGGAQAFGTGSAYVSDCTPTCASGQVRRYPIVLVVSGIQHCPDGSTAYRQVTYASPVPLASLRNLSVQETFPCRG